MKAIVYSSNTGFTAEYARILSEKTGLPVYTIDQAQASLAKDDEVIFMSWLMAGKITDLKKVKARFNLKAICAVGLCETDSLIEETKKSNKIDKSLPVFTLQGGYAPEKLSGIYKFLMKIVTKVLIKKIDKTESPTESDKRMKSTLQNGGSYVGAENLNSVLKFIGKSL